MQKIFYFLFFIQFSLAISAQKINISGYVVDSLSNEKLIGTNIWEKTTNLGTITNEYGFFSLTINNKQELDIYVSYVGYETKKIELKHDTSLVIGLKSDNQLGEVEICAHGQIEKQNRISTIQLPMKEINMLPAIAGERSIIKAYQMLPGIQRGYEGGSGLYVRGGSPDQNLILLDDVPLYNINHLGGFVDIFNSDAIKSSKIIKGGFPAEYGGRLSSVLDIRMKDGNNQKRNNSYSIGLLSSKVMFEGPIKKGKSSYMISGRYLWADLFLRPLQYLFTNNWVAYTFYDCNIKINQYINSKNHVYLSFYSGDDISSINAKSKNGKLVFSKKWGNKLLAIRWNHLYSERLFSNITLSYTQYRSNIIVKNQEKKGNSTSNFQFNNYSGTKDFRLKNDFNLFVSPHWNIKYGANFILHLNYPADVYQISKIDGKVNYEYIQKDSHFLSYEGALYLENKFYLENGFSGNWGVRFADYAVNKQNYYSIEPRLLLNYNINKRYKLSLAYSQMQQYIHFITGSGPGMQADFWMPATRKVPPMQSQQITTGFATTLFNSIELSVEGFYKEMQHLSTFKEGISYYNINTNWEKKVETGGNGKVFGIEFLLQKKIGKNTGWLAYTWSKNTRQFANINNGRVYPFRYDRRHDLSIVYNLKINKKIDFSCTWVYSSGEALTLPETRYQGPNITIDKMNMYHSGTEDIYSAISKNAVRGKDYHRLDIGINFRRQKKKGIRTWNFSIYNIYNRKNPFFYSPGESIHKQNGITTGRAGYYSKTMFPIFPSVSYSYKF